MKKIGINDEFSHFMIEMDFLLLLCFQKKKKVFKV